MKVSIKDISERTGFSPATVSNALNHKKGVNADTAAEIFRVAKEMGYISESRIGKIKFVIFKRNGLIIDDTPFFSLLIDGIEKEMCIRDRNRWVLREMTAGVPKPIRNIF